MPTTMLEWKNINIEVLNKSRTIKGKYFEIIKNASGSAKPGELIAIMGPSGGGKTTLLNALSGNIPPRSRTQGKITDNGQIRQNDWLDKTGYVNQIDILYEDLSVRETLEYSALFRKTLKNVDKDESIKLSFIQKIKAIFYKDQLKKKIDDLISDLKLTKCSDNIVKRLSGGEKKRLMIGIELISEPNILFLDEPTSGLDTFTALKIMKILKDLAVKYNKTIISSIHQPSQEIFYLFDSIYLVNNGNVIYSGKVSKIEKYFTKKGLIRRQLATVPEFILEICSEEFQKEHSDLFYGTKPFFREKPLIKDKSIQKSSNDFVIGFLFNIPHIILLLIRRIKMRLSRKFSFFKALLTRLFIYSIFTGLLFLFYSFYSRTSKRLLNAAVTQLPSDIDINQFKKAYRKLSSILFFKLFHEFAFFPIIFSQLNNAISFFIDDIKITRKIISLGTYSSTSFYISSFLYLILYETMCTSWIFIMYLLFYPELLLKKFVLFIFLTPFVTTTNGIFIASLTSSKTINKIISNFFCALLTIPTKYIIILLEYYQQINESVKTIVYWVSFLTIMCPTYLYFSIISFFITKTEDNFEILGDLNSLDNLLHLNKKDKILSIFGLKELTSNRFLLLFSLSLIINLVLGIVFLGFLVMPDIRYNLEKNEKSEKNNKIK